MRTSVAVFAMERDDAMRLSATWSATYCSIALIAALLPPYALFS
jgi:hypothetical protein